MKKSTLSGFLASTLLVAFYLAIMFLFTRSLSVAISQIRELFFWFSLLVVGFGIQFGLFTYLKELVKGFSSDGGPERYSSEVKPGRLTAANTGMSGVSMVACCAHHLTDVLPFFGLAGVSLFLTRYQVWLLGVGIISNLIGIIYISRQIRRHLSYVQN